MRAFLAVAESGGFSRAAAGLSLSPSSVTRAVAELEDDLGVQLFTRTTRRVTLTQAGRDYRDRVSPILDELDRANDDTRAASGALRGTLRVSAPLSLGLRALAGPLARFRAQHPDITLNVDLTDRFVDIMDGDYDMALRISAPPGDLSTIWRKIRPIPRSLVASPDYLKERGTPQHARDLGAHDGLGYGHGPAPDVWQLSGPESPDMAPAPIPFRFASNNGDLIAEMAASGAGITLLPDFLTARYIKAGHLVTVLPDWTSPEIWLTAFYPPYQKIPALIEAFASEIEHETRDLLLN